MAKQQIGIRLDVEMLDRIEQAKGHRDRTMFIEEAIEEKLAGETPKVATPVAGKRATARAAAAGHRPSCRCPVCAA